MNDNSLICKFIHDHPDTWRDIMEEKNIKMKTEGDLTIFNYTLFSEYSDPIVQEARGIIIDTKKLEPVCWPFRKFANHVESYADDINWKTARVQDKIDGSIVKLWCDKRTNEWVWSTNSMIHASDTTNSLGYNFLRLIKSADNFSDIDTSKLNPDCTYMFELVSPVNTIVIKYDKTRLYHTGTRNNITGKEINVDIGIQKPQEYKLSSLDECIKASNKLNEGHEDNVKKEGFVVVDENYHRIKIKSPEYLIYHHVVSEDVLKKEDAIKMLLDDNFDLKKFCVTYPKFATELKYYDYKITELFERTDEMMRYTQNLYEEFSHERKAVAAQILKHPMAEVGFWGLDHPEGAPKEFWTRDMRKINEAIPKYDKVLITEMKKEPVKSRNRAVRNVEAEKSRPKTVNDIRNEPWYQKVNKSKALTTKPHDEMDR